MIASGEAEINYDTLSDLPQPVTFPFLNQLVLSKLRECPGWAVKGSVAPEYGAGTYWGQGLKLETGEVFYLRAYPKGVIGAVAADYLPELCFVATRREMITGMVEVAFAILWTADRELQHVESIEGLTGQSVSSVGAHNLHVVLPSLFHHHQSSKSAPDRRISLYDEFNFHSIQPSTFTIHSTDKNGMRVQRAGPGYSPWLLAGQLAGVDIPDHMRCVREDIALEKWMGTTGAFASELRAKAEKQEVADMAIVNAYVLTDLLTCEGLVGLLNTPFFEGAMPDFMFVPCGFPLLIAMALRLASRAEWYDLGTGSAADRLAAQEFNAHFESNWDHFPGQGSGRRIYAIDLAIKAAWRDGKESAVKLEVGRACYDNLTFWQRAGQRCLNVMFSTAEDLKPRAVSKYGSGGQTIDPVEEAARCALRKKMGKPYEPLGGIKGVWQHQSHSDRRRKLFEIVDFVEHWLRTGRFRSIQVNVPNTQTMQKAASRKQQMDQASKNLKDAIEQGVEASVQEMLQEGGQDELHARAMAKLIYGEANERVEEIMRKKEAEMDRKNKQAVEAASALQGKDVGDDVNIHAFGVATACMAAAFCQGTVVMHQFGMASFLVSETSVDLCADCDKPVHVLEAMFLTTQYGRCLKCFRHRCETCQKKAFQHFTKNPARSSVMSGCLRCQAPKKKARKSSEAEPSSAKA